MRKDDLWTIKKYLYPILALILVYILWTDVRAEVIPVRLKDGSLCLMETKVKYPVLSFNVCYPAKRGARL